MKNNQRDQKKQAYMAFTFVAVVVAAGLMMFFITETAPKPVQDPTIAAISTMGPDLNANISEFFGRSPYFLIYDLKTDTFRSIKNPYLRETHAAGMRTGIMLAAYGVGTILCKNIGVEPMNKFRACKINVHIGASGTVTDAITQFKSGLLIATTRANVPTHFGVAGQAPCPNILGQPNTRVDNPMLPAPPVTAKVQQIAFPVQNGRGSGWTLNCPKCNALITINDSNISLSNKIICPVCGNKGTLGFTSQAKGTLK